MTSQKFSASEYLIPNSIDFAWDLLSEQYLVFQIKTLLHHVDVHPGWNLWLHKSDHRAL